MSALQKLGINISKINEDIIYSENQSQTQNAFSFKWEQRNSYESDMVKLRTTKWLFERYCAGDSVKLTEWLSGGKKIILDAGCGSGFSALLFFGEHLKQHDYLGIDISDAVEVAKVRFTEMNCPGEFLKMSIMDIPAPAESVDIIFSEGVLHHTDSTQDAIKYLSKKLRKGGRFLFYVYRKKAVIREFTDDYIREGLQGMSDSEAWQALESLSKLGIALGKLNIELDVPEDIPFLGIKKGKIDIQRFFYWNICKLYYHQDYSLDEMNHVNFDWFRPLNCHRHTPEEIEQWCLESQLDIEHMDIQEAGITVVARRQ